MAARRKHGRKKSKFKTIWDRLSRSIKIWRRKSGQLPKLFAGMANIFFRKCARLPLFLKIIAVYLLTLALVGGIFLWRINRYRSVNPYFIPPVHLGELEDLLHDRDDGTQDEKTEPAGSESKRDDLEPLPGPLPPPGPAVHTAGWPVKEAGQILQEYGKPVISGTIYGQWLSFSNGIAIAVDPGTEILAVLGGVAKVVQLGGPYLHFGYEVTIDHAQNLNSIYQTLESVSVQNGTVVEKGQAVGIIKNRTPNPTYLYLEMHKEGKAVDPLDYLR